MIPFPRSGAGEAVIDDTSDNQGLLDFLAADVAPVSADPAFRDRLREELWEMVLDEGVGGKGDREDS